MLTSLREKKKRRTRADILAAAADLMEREGYRNANMRDIAAAADVAYQTLYNYFPSKARIALALLARGTEDAEVLPDDEADVVGTLVSLTDSLARRIVAGDREVWREAIVEVIRNDETPVVRCLDPALGERFAGLLGAAQQHGHLDAYLDTDAMASVIESLLGSALLAWATSGEHGREAIESVPGNIELVLKPYQRSAR
ncbi:MAG: TetR/AcrR family transcriptional regulator [Gammaproteobacteria bacterium]|nr:TetR/AcrR family transcriptional regulator [Gammaproteobacteria bacterium]